MSSLNNRTLCCPNSKCKNLKYSPFLKKAGFYFRNCDSKKVQRYQCLSCKKYFSNTTGTLEFGHKKRREVPMLRHLLCSGVSMRRSAKILKINQKTVARKLRYLAQKAKLNHHAFLEHIKEQKVTNIQIDDLITIEHTKLKPISVSVLINSQTRQILQFEVSKIPAFGHLAEKSRKKYGKRENELPRNLKKLIQSSREFIATGAIVKSDEHKLYKELIARHLQHVHHETYKSERSSVAGQGELKKIKFDPIFSVNHCLAMLRANINRLIRKTWCTTKDPRWLKDHLFVYIDYHNQELVV